MLQYTAPIYIIQVEIEINAHSNDIDKFFGEVLCISGKQENILCISRDISLVRKEKGGYNWETYYSRHYNS